MLRKINKIDFTKYIDFAYELSMNIKKCSYPLYSDGIKTKEDFIKNQSESFNNDDEEILFFELNGEVLGWINYFVIKEDNYIQISCFSIKEHIDTALNEFIDYIKYKFNNYELYLGFPEDNIDANKYLNENATLIENSYNNILFLEDIFIEKTENDIIKINKTNYSLFAKLHIDKDMYWTAERIYEDIDSWDIS